MGNRKQPFGYKMEWGCIVPHPQEAETVGYIYRQYLAGASFKTLTETLREQNVPYDMGKAWNKNMVARVLEDSRYTGTDRFPMLVTQEQFDAVQQRRQRVCPQKRQTEAQKELRKLFGAVPPVSVQRKVLQLLNTLIEESERIAAPPRSPAILPRYELDTILASPPVDEERARRLALDHAGAVLSGISTEAYETQRLRRLFSRAQLMPELDADLLRQSVRRITYTGSKVRLLLKNNQWLEGELI